MLRSTLLCIMLTCFVASTGAQESGVMHFLHSIGTKIDSMTISGVDRRYIDMPKEPWQFILRTNVNRSDLKMMVNADYEDLSYGIDPHLKTEPSYYVGLWAGYRGYGFGYSVNVAGDKGSLLTFGVTGSNYGLNLRIHRFENDEPEFTLRIDENGQQASYSDNVSLVSPIKIRTLILDGFYLFNRSRFSYSAAYDQSVYQLRSAGSFLVGGMYYHGHINFADNYNAELIELMKNIGRVKMWQASIGAGYAYNWVPCKGLLVSAMAIPMITFVNDVKVYGYTTNLNEIDLPEDLEDVEAVARYYNQMRIQEVKSETKHGRVGVNIDARMSLTYNFGRYFINTYGQYNTFRYRHDNDNGRLNDWYIYASMGVRL